MGPELNPQGPAVWWRAGALYIHRQKWNRLTWPRAITEQRDRITVMKMKVHRPRVKAVGLSGRVQELWVLVREARHKWILKRPRVCGAWMGANEDRRVTESSLSWRCKWARLRHTPQSFATGLPERILFP